MSALDTLNMTGLGVWVDLQERDEPQTFVWGNGDVITATSWGHWDKSGVVVERYVGNIRQVIQSDIPPPPFFKISMIFFSINNSSPTAS